VIYLLLTAHGLLLLLPHTARLPVTMYYSTTVDYIQHTGLLVYKVSHKVKVKVKRYSSSWQVISELRGVTCHMGWM